jgi:hypothetical protein
MALENTVIQDKLTAFGENASFQAGKDVFFRLKYLLTKLQRLPLFKK